MPWSLQSIDLPTVVVAFFTLFVAKYLFKLYTHPLNSVPGPFLAKFTSARFLYHAWKGDLHLDHVRCHLKYGCLDFSSPGLQNGVLRRT